MVKEDYSAHEKMRAAGHFGLNEFAAACLDSAQNQLRASGTATTTVSFGYGINSHAREPVISQYEPAFHETDEDGKEEAETIRNYARKTGSEAVGLAMDIRDDAKILAAFPEYNGVLLIAALSPAGTVTIMRPYRKGGAEIVFGDPRVTDAIPIPLLEGIFEQSDHTDVDPITGP